MATVHAIAETRSSHPKPFFGYIPELDVIRAVAVTMVILNHMWPHSTAHHRGWDLLNLSWIWMDSFFVLSGFLIGGILLDTRCGPGYFKNFYTRRAFRILPVYYLLITILTIASALLGTGYLYGGIPALYRWGSPWWFFAYIGNVPPAITGVIPTAANGAFVPLWSLQIEEQFYLLFPLLVFYLKPKVLGRTLLGFACLSPLLRILLYWREPGNLWIQYVLLPCHMEGLALGAWVALRFRTRPWVISKPKLTLSTVLMIGLTVFCGARGGYIHTSAFNRTVGFSLSSIASTLAVIWLVVHRGSSLTAILRISAVKFLAKISYSAYLFHIPVSIVLLALATKFNLQWLSYERFLRVAAVYCLTILLSALSWRFIENPLLRLRDRLF